MYTHATTRARVLRSQDAFRAHTQMHADDLLVYILKLVVQEVFIAAAATVVAWAYMHAAMRIGVVWLAVA